MYFYIINYNLEIYIEKYFHDPDRKKLYSTKLYRRKNSSSSHLKLFFSCIFPDLYTNENTL